MFFFLIITFCFAEPQTYTTGIIYATNLDGSYERFQLEKSFQQGNENYFYRVEYDEDGESCSISLIQRIQGTSGTSEESVKKLDFEKCSTEIPFYDSEFVIIPTSKTSIENLDDVVYSTHYVVNECFQIPNDEFFNKIVIDKNTASINIYPSLDDCLKNQNKDTENSKTYNCGSNTNEYVFCKYDADNYETTGTIYTNLIENMDFGYREFHLGTCFMMQYDEQNENNNGYMEFVKQGNKYLSISYTNNECEYGAYPQLFNGNIKTQKPTSEVKAALLYDDLECPNKDKDEVGMIEYYTVDKCVKSATLAVDEGNVDCFSKATIAENKLKISHYSDNKCETPLPDKYSVQSQEYKCNTCETMYYADCDFSDGIGIENLECLEENHEKFAEDGKSCVCVDGYEKKTDKCSKICLEKDHEKTSQDGESCVCIDGYEKKDNKCVSGAFSTFILAVLAILFFFF